MDIVFIFSLILGLMVVGFLTAALIIKIIVKNNYRKCQLKVTGVVIDVKRVSKRFTNDSSCMISWAPVFKYYVNNECYTKMSSVRYANKDKFKIGDEINVYVDELNPKHCFVFAEETNMIKNVFIVVSIICFIILILLNTIGRRAFL